MDLLNTNHEFAQPRLTPRETFVASTLVHAVPHWYGAECGPYRHALHFAGGGAHPFYSISPLSSRLQGLLEFAGAKATEWASAIPEFPSRLNEGRIGQDLALFWLESHATEVNWSKVLAYLQEVSYRTYEGTQVSLNLIVKPGRGRVDLSAPGLQKVLDPLGSSDQVALVVDPELRYLDYVQIPWRDIPEQEALHFHPDFVQPFFSLLQPGEFAAMVTNHGDILVVGTEGILASERFGRWFVYDNESFRSVLSRASVGSWLPANLFQVVFDLSYRRRGALILHDPDGSLEDRVVNQEAFLEASGAPADSVQSLLAHKVSTIELRSRRVERGERRLLAEIAGVDGAVIVDDERVRAFGAIVEPHPDAGGTGGARETAALSAFLWGVSPVKISSEGDITTYFKSRQGPQECDAQLTFM
ncbi:MAG: hypothetical protein RQ748_12280 [Elusimicrobiales bacterium]|nr:hypothetical protein [Elusimicrobiales bacterium]